MCCVNFEIDWCYVHCVTSAQKSQDSIRHSACGLQKYSRHSHIEPACTCTYYLCICAKMQTAWKLRHKWICSDTHTHADVQMPVVPGSFRVHLSPVLPQGK